MGISRVGLQRSTLCLEARYKEMQDKVTIRGMTPPPCPKGRASSVRPVNVQRYSYTGADAQALKALDRHSSGRRRSLMLISCIPAPDSVQVSKSVSPTHSGQARRRITSATPQTSPTPRAGSEMTLKRRAAAAKGTKTGRKKAKATTAMP
eukprot:TRINITY_DN26018_c0_g1_i1.p1 TRINITY_DN26018_c0_g1~~TRINITY_DN26018_c0_g1_i1.p1  ORF type:complete len:150 (+),score=40.78 TRINITY_DN26018_c0_g1_i1:168-617(+)